MSTTDDVPKEGISLKATYADCILASKNHLDEAAAVLAKATEDRLVDEEAVMALRQVNTLSQLGIGYARLAQACQKVPGEPS